MLQICGKIDFEELRKSFERGPRPGHKYISRRWSGKRWLYKYRKTRADRHGPEHAGDDELHTLPIKNESHEYSHPPEDAYRLAAWQAKLDKFLDTGIPQVLNDVDGKPKFSLHPSKYGTKYRFIVTDKGTNKQRRFKDKKTLRRFLKKKAQDPVPVYDIQGDLHHTLIPSQSKKKRDPKRGTWMRAVFNPDNPRNFYGAHQRSFRTKEEYDEWWQEQKRFHQGAKDKSKVNVRQSDVVKRPYTSALELGHIPWKVKEKKIKGFMRPTWEIAPEKLGIPREEFVQNLVEEHAGLLTLTAARYVKHHFPEGLYTHQQRERIMNDLVRAAVAGILEAANRYNPSKGYRFSSFMGTWIDANVRRQARRELELQVEVGEHERVAPETGEEVDSLLVADDDPSLNIDLQRMWWKKQDKAFQAHLGKVSDQAVKKLVTSKFKEFQSLKDAPYEVTQMWVADNMELPYVIPIDEPRTYLTKKQADEILGTRVPGRSRRGKWTRLLKKYFEGKKKGRGKAKSNYYALARDMIKDFAPDGNLRDSEMSFASLGDKYKDRLESLFGDPKNPMLTKEDRTDHVTKMFQRELPALVNDSDIYEFVSSISTDMQKVKKALRSCLRKALVGIAVEQTRDLFAKRLVAA